MMRLGNIVAIEVQDASTRIEEPVVVKLQAAG
jgi:hypothetical protein